MFTLCGAAVVHIIFQHISNPGLYTAETVEAPLRRILGPFQTVGNCLGFLLAYTTSAFLPWRTCKLILGSFITLPAALLIQFLHETPHWLVKKGKLDDAR